MSAWAELGGVAPRDLTETRLQLHWASQLVAAVGSSLVAAKPDDSHTALTYDVERSLLVSAETETSPSRRVALSVPDFRLVLLDDELREVAGCTLDGKTLHQGLDWLGVELSASALSVPDYDMPHHDGMELLQALQSAEQWQHLPMILMIDELDPELNQRALSVGAMLVLDKPIDIDTMLCQLNMFWELTAQRDAKAAAGNPAAV